MTSAAYQKELTELRRTHDMRTHAYAIGIADLYIKHGMDVPAYWQKRAATARAKAAAK